MNSYNRPLAAATLALLAVSPVHADDAEPFIGRWALTIPGDRAGWLGVTQEQGYLDASILWGGGSVVPVAHVYVFEDMLVVTRTHTVERKDKDGKVVRKHTVTETLSGRLLDDGKTMHLTRYDPSRRGIGLNVQQFTGARIPDLPPKPDLSKVKYGDAIELFNGKNLEGWTLTNPRQTNGWRAENGVLINDPKQEEGKPHVSYGNLRTEDEFEDFNLQMDVRVPKDGNSGVYLRGIYEVQVLDSYGEPRDSHHMGAIYSRITPSTTAEKAPGEWQQLDMTLKDRHITVKLNGTTIVDNEPLLGVTGGALWADEFRPGPIYLQGDHTGVEYRNIVLRPIRG